MSESGSESESVVADLNEKSESEENEDDVFLFDSNIPSVPSISHSESGEEACSDVGGDALN